MHSQQLDIRHVELCTCRIMHERKSPATLCLRGIRAHLLQLDDVRVDEPLVVEDLPFHVFGDLRQKI